MSTSKMEKMKYDNFTTNNRKIIVFGMFSRYFSLIWMIAVSNFLLKDVLYMFLYGKSSKTLVTSWVFIDDHVSGT